MIITLGDNLGGTDTSDPVVDGSLPWVETHQLLNFIVRGGEQS